MIAPAFHQLTKIEAMRQRVLKRLNNATYSVRGATMRDLADLANRDELLAMYTDGLLYAKGSGKARRIWISDHGKETLR